MFTLKRLVFGFLLGLTLYANISPARNIEVQKSQSTWHDSSYWLYHALTSNFAKNADDYDVAINVIDGVAMQSREYGAFEYTYALNIDAMQNDRALNLAEIWVATYPEDSEAHLALIQALVLKNEQERAYAEMYTVLSKDAGPQNVAQINRLLTYLNDGMQRLLILEKLSNQFPDNPYLYYYLGINAREQGQVDLAIIAFGKALAIDSDWRQLELMQAEVLSDIGALRQAKKMMDDLRKRYPKDIKILSQEVEMFISHYHWDEALKIAKIWDQLTPGDRQVQELIAWLYAHKKDYKYAKQAYDYLLQHKVISEDEFAFQMAQAEVYVNKKKEAKERLASISSNSRLYMMARQQMALMTFDDGDVARGEAEFATLRQDFPDYALEFYLVEISKLNQAKAYKSVAIRIEKALQDYPKQIDLLYARAEYLSISGEVKEASEVYQEILAIDPANIDALNAYGYLLLTQTEQQEEAQNMIEKAIKYYPDSPVIQDSYAWLLYQKGKKKEALSWLQRAYSAYRKNEIAAHYIEVLSANEKTDLAKEIYTNERLGQPENDYLIAVGKKMGWYEK